MPISKTVRSVAATAFCAGLYFSPLTYVTARETTAPVNNAQLASVHQSGILRTGSKLTTKHLLPLPNFVHSLGSSPVCDTWMDYSMLYLGMPQLTTEPMLFTVRQGLAGPPAGSVTHYYPYAAGISATNDFIDWKYVQVGVMADGLETTHPTWMKPRAVAGAATVKVYKPGPPGSKPDDAGTTEGEVFLFMRAALNHTSAPITASHDKTSNEWVVNPAPGVSITENTSNAWLARSISTDTETILARRLKLDSADDKLLPTRTRAAIEGDLYTTTTLDLRTQLNEALVGNGLQPDEASALSALVIRSLSQVNCQVLIYLVPPDWTDANIPLHIKGPAKIPVRVLVGLAEIRD